MYIFLYNLILCPSTLIFEEVVVIFIGHIQPVLPDYISAEVKGVMT